jgi:hypothetical protein
MFGTVFENLAPVRNEIPQRIAAESALHHTPIDTNFIQRINQKGSHQPIVERARAEFSRFEVEHGDGLAICHQGTFPGVHFQLTAWSACTELELLWRKV